MRKKLVGSLLVVAVVVLAGAGFLGGVFGGVGKVDGSGEEVSGSEKGEESLLNIAELPEEFMEDYFGQYGEVASDEEKGNMLIVTSSTEVAETYGATSVIVAPNNQYILQYETETAKVAALEKLRGDDMIVGVDENDMITLDDAGYNSWGIEAMALDGAFAAMDGGDWPEVRVAVIDTGCDVELVNRHYPGKIAETYDVLNKSTESMGDTYGHGTHVTGIVAEGTPANVKVMAVKVGEGKSLRTSDVIAAINYVVYYEKADVINMSFGLYKYNTALYDAIAAANQKNVISVAAAGNDNVAQASYPAGFDNTISVASVDVGLKKSAFSNYNPTVDFAAPGTSIKSTLAGYMTLSKADGDDDFEVVSGTSMAAPHVASAVAVLRSYNKELSRDDAVELLRDYATQDLGVAGKDDYYGYGFVRLRPEAFCGEGDECEDRGVFKADAKVEVAGIEVKEAIATDRNYGTVNNLTPVRVEVVYSDEVRLAANLGELGGAEITGYDAEATGEQTVTVEWQGQQVSFAFTNPENWVNGWEYEPVGDGAAKITGFVDFNGGYATKVLYIPEKIDGREVVEIASASDGSAVFSWANKASYEEIVLPKTLTEVSASLTFNGFSAVKRIVALAPELRLTANNVFGDNPSLTEVVGKIARLGGSDFIGDAALERVTLAESLTEVAPNAFNGCEALMEIELPQELKTIGAFAFAYTGLEKLYIPESVEEIGDMALFKGDGKYVTIWTKARAYARTYAVENRVPYVVIDPEVVFDESIMVEDDKLAVWENSFAAMKEGITTDAASSEYTHYDKNRQVVETDVLKTGDMVKLVLNGAQEYEYRVAVLGDTSGDGKVSYLDYVNVYNHIQKLKNPELDKALLADEYLMAADVSRDGKVTYLDYVKIYNKIKEMKR